MFGRLVRLTILSLAVCAGFGPVHAWAAPKIGVASAAQNQVEGVQGGASRALAAGSQVFQDETIRTGAKSMAQLLFLDETSLSIGPQSEVTLDKFVYNPATGVGDVILSATKGAFRFITGSQDPANYQLKTGVATIGVRGTIADCYLTLIGLYCIAQEGTVILIIDGVPYTLGPGQAVFVSADKKVTGPMASDDEFFRIAGIPPFPLYGGRLPGEHEHADAPDGSTIRTDDLFDHPEPMDPCDASFAVPARDPLRPLLVPVAAPCYDDYD